MLQQFITALSGLLTPFLLFMAMDSVLVRGEDRRSRLRRRWLLGGASLGLGAAVVFAILRSTAVISQQTILLQPALTVGVTVDLLLLVCLILVLVKREGDSTLMTTATVLAAVCLAVDFFIHLPDVIIQLTNFVATGESPFTSAMLLRSLGFLTGVAGAGLVAWIFSSIRGSVSPRLFALTALVFLLLLTLQDLTSLVQILVNTGSLLLGDAAFVTLAWLINHHLALVLAQVFLFLLPASAALVAGFRLPSSRMQSLTWQAQAGDAAAARIGRKFRRHAFLAAAWCLVALLFVGVSLTYGVSLTHQEVVLSAPEKYRQSEGTAIIPYSQLADGHLHRFQYKASDGTVMRFIIIKKAGGAYGVGLDACENCGDAGYYEKDGKIICKKCDVAINLATIGFKGGCNPIPLPYQSQGGKITIKTSDLDALSSHFKNA